MFYEILKNFFYFELGLLLTYFFGSFIFKLLFHDNGKVFNIFFKVILALLSFFITYSLIFLKSSISYTIFIPLMILIFLNRKEISFNNPLKKLNLREEGLSLSVLFLISIIIYSFTCLSFFKYESFPFIIQHSDFFDYAKNSQSIMQSGNENYFRESNIFFPKFFSGVTPYHYFEIHLNSFYNYFFRISYIKCLSLISFPIIQSCYLLGVISLIIKALEKTLSLKKTIFLAFLIVSIQPIYFPFYEKMELFNYSIGICQTSALSFGKKYSSVIIFILLFYLLYFLKYKRSAFIILSSICIFSAGLTPAILIGLTLFYIVEYFIKKDKYYLFLLSYNLLFNFLILFYYKIFSLSVTESLIESQNIIGIIYEKGLDLYVLKQFIFKIVFPLFRLIAFSSPYLIICYFILFKNKVFIDKSILLLNVLIILSGSLGSAIAFNLPDSGQLLYNSIPFLNLMFAVFIAFTLKSPHFKFKYILLFFVATYNVYCNLEVINKMNNYTSKKIFTEDSSLFFNACLEEIKKDNFKNPLVGYIKDADEILAQHEVFSPPTLFLEYSDNQPIVCSLNNPDLFSNIGLSNYYKKMIPICVNQIVKKGAHNKSLNVFIENYNFRYILVEKNSSLPSIDKKISLVAEDEKSGFKFYKLHKE